MMRYRSVTIIILLLIPFLYLGCKVQRRSDNVYQSQSLKITRICKNVWLHTSYLKIPNYGNFPCNGLIFNNKDEVVVFDTTINDSTSVELIDWITKEKGLNIKAVVINHFHNDCLGGLQAFHNKNITSYAYEQTITFANDNNEVVPKIGFEKELNLLIGKEEVITSYFGPGHTDDNVVSYIPSKQILFGGCLIKSSNSGKGNLEDANTQRWSETVMTIKKAYPKLKIVIPGHGQYGSTELLNYTINKFK